MSVIKLSSFKKTKVVEIKTIEGNLTIEVKTLTAGDEMEANQVSTKLVDIGILAEKRRKGEEIEMAEHIKIDQVKLSILRVIKGMENWNLADDKGKVLPIDEDTLKLVPQTIFDEINKAIEDCSYIPKEDQLKNS